MIAPVPDAADQPRLYAIWHTDTADGSTRVAGFCGTRAQAVSIARAFEMMGCLGVQLHLWVEPVKRPVQTLTAAAAEVAEVTPVAEKVSQPQAKVAGEFQAGSGA
jgi:hypothetical protein